MGFAGLHSPARPPRLTLKVPVHQGLVGHLDGIPSCRVDLRKVGKGRRWHCRYMKGTETTLHEHSRTRRHLSEAAELRVFEGACMLTDSERRSEEHTSELQSRLHLVCRLLLEQTDIDFVLT